MSVSSWDFDVRGWLESKPRVEKQILQNIIIMENLYQVSLDRGLDVASLRSICGFHILEVNQDKSRVQAFLIPTLFSFTL